MIPVWQSARPCAERRPRRKTPKHSSAALLVGAAATFARTLVADTGTTFGLAVSPSRKAAKSFCAGCIRCWSVAAMNRTQPRFTQSNNQLYDFLENGSKWSKKFKINISKVEAIRPFFYALKSNFYRTLCLASLKFCKQIVNNHRKSVTTPPLYEYSRGFYFKVLFPITEIHNFFALLQNPLLYLDNRTAWVRSCEASAGS